MSEIRATIKEIEELGLTIGDNNKDYECTSIKAEEYMRGSVGKFVLGSVPSWLEELSNIDTEITYNILETYAPEMSEEDYVLLEGAVLKNDLSLFKKSVDESSISEKVKEKLIGEAEDWEDSILGELEEIINAFR